MKRPTASGVATTLVEAIPMCSPMGRKWHRCCRGRPVRPCRHRGKYQQSIYSSGAAARMLRRIELGYPVGLEARVLHYKDKKGLTAIATYEGAPLQQDNSGAEARKWQAWFDNKAVINEDLVLQLVSAQHRVEGEILRLQAWYNLRTLQRLGREE